MLKELLTPEILELIELRSWASIREVLQSWSPAEIADLMLGVKKQDRVFLYRALGRDIGVEVFSYLEPDDQDQLLVDLTDQETRDLLEELPGAVSHRLLSLLSPEDLREARWLMGYPEESVGRFMTPDFVAVRAGMNVAEAIEHIKRHGQDSETINRIYVLDERGSLLDDIMLRTIILADEQMYIRDLMDQNVISISAFDDQEVAVRTMEKYDLPAIPVVDSTGILVGIVTFDDIFDIAQEEATEDIQKLGGMEALDDTYRATNILELVRKRAGWLSILMVSELMTTSVLAFFEGTIERAAVLVLFIPLVMSSGGNSGSQAASLIIRALALDEIRLQDWWLVMRREIISGFLLGLILGGIGFARIELWAMAGATTFGPHHMLVACTVALTLVGIVLWGTIAGSMLPFVLKKMGFDPAVSSAPFVATLVDVFGIIIYFAVALVILNGTLL
jgi:magnesium transporter